MRLVDLSSRVGRRRNIHLEDLLLTTLLNSLPGIGIRDSHDLRGRRHEIQQSWVVSLATVGGAGDHHGPPTFGWQMANESQRTVYASAALRREVMNDHDDGLHDGSTRGIAFSPEAGFFAALSTVSRKPNAAS